MLTGDKKIVASFFNTYNSIINAKLDNGDYELKQMDITIRVSDRFDIKMYPHTTIWYGNGDTPLIEITIIRYADITGYARKHNIIRSYGFNCRENDDEYNLYSLYYNKSNEIYSTLNIPKSDGFSLFKEIYSDIRVEKIDRLL